MSDTLRFRSKVDAWILLLPWSSLAALVLIDGQQRVWLGIAMTVVSVSVEAWLILSTSYTLTDDALVVQCAALRVNVPLRAIRSIRRTKTPVAAPALSLDRLEVLYQYGSVIISPKNREGFVRAIQARTQLTIA